MDNKNKNIFGEIISLVLALFSNKNPAPVPKVDNESKLKPSDPVVEPAVVKKPAFTLTRKRFRDDGIFSELRDKDNNLVANTLEHSYNKKPKIPNGVWKCVRGPHRLHGMTKDFITFEITGISGHTNLLFHWGNYNKDSEGCVLVGENVAKAGDIEMVTNSKVTFAKFMASLEGVDEFDLLVN